MITNIVSADAWKLIVTNKKLLLVDVRTVKEWTLDGVPVIYPSNLKSWVGEQGASTTEYSSVFEERGFPKFDTANSRSTKGIIPSGHNTTLLFSEYSGLSSEWEELYNKLTNFKAYQTCIFICRSGGRSAKAAKLALQNQLFKECINIVDGFMGSSFGAGWKNSNLPWDYYQNVK